MGNGAAVTPADTAGRIGPAAADLAVTVEGVVKAFSTVTAVDNLDFGVRRGQVFALLGPNGAGKTTMVRMLCGITQPDAGRLSFRPFPDSPAAPRLQPQLLGYLPEERGLYGDQKVLATLLYFASLRGVPAETARSRALEWLGRFGLEARSDDKVQSLSKGNQQKVQFIASVLHRPAVAVLDEPFSGFDPVNQDLVGNVIRELRASGMTIVLSAHHMDLVETLADEILLMHHGRKVLAGTMNEIRAGSGMGQRLDVTFGEDPSGLPLAGVPGVREVLSLTATSARLALDPGAAVGDVLHQLTGVGFVTDVATGTPSLREIYLAAVNGEPA